MIPKHLEKNDKVAIVSLSSGILGENFIKHELDLGIKRLKEFGLEPVFMPNSTKGIVYIKEHPEARAEDLKNAFLDKSIKAIICAIGGDDTYRTLPFLLEDNEFKEAVKNNPKIFLGFSDSTINHFMFYKLGLPTFYGQAFLPDLAELDKKMLPYSKDAFLNLFNKKFNKIISSKVWYLERHDFSPTAVGTKRDEMIENKGFENIQSNGTVEGILFGGCLESMYDIISGKRYNDQLDIFNKYNLFLSKEEWSDKILLLETSEEQPTVEEYKTMLEAFKNKGVFESVKAIIVGKPMDEKYYEEYKTALIDVINNPNLPILYNINIGHSTPRCILPLQSKITVDLDKKELRFDNDVLS